MGTFNHVDKLKKTTKLGEIYLDRQILVDPVDAPFRTLHDGAACWTSATPADRMVLSDNINGDLLGSAEYDRFRVLADLSYSITADAPTEYDFAIAVNGTVWGKSTIHSGQQTNDEIKSVSIIYESPAFEPYYKWFQIKIRRTAGAATVVLIHTAHLAAWSD